MNEMCKAAPYLCISCPGNKGRKRINPMNKWFRGQLLLFMHGLNF